MIHTRTHVQYKGILTDKVRLPWGLLCDVYSREGDRSTVGSSVSRLPDARPPGLLAPELAVGTEL